MDPHAEESTPASASPAEEPKGAAVAPIVVRVRDLEGRPIEGAQLIDRLDGTLEERTRTTDARGVVSIRGGRSLSVSAPGFASFAAPITPRGPNELRLAPGSVIAGRVVDGRGVGLAGVEVEMDEGGRAQARTKTDAEGGFRFDGLWPGRRLLKARGGVVGDHMVGLGLAETVAVDLVVAKAATVEAQVVGTDGAPCTGGSVTLLVGVEGSTEGCPICGGEDSTVYTSIAADGKVRVELAHGLVYGVEVECDGTMTATPDPIVVGDDDIRGLRWVVERGLQARGRVVDDEGRPQAGIEVLLRSDDDGPISDLVGDRRAVTNAEGRFVLRGLVEGDYEVELFTEVPENVYYQGRGQLVIEGADVSDVVFTVSGEPWEENDRDDDDDDDEPVDGGADAPVARARGVVVDAEGRPVAGAIVLARGAEPQLPEVLGLLGRSWDGRSPSTSDAKGMFAAPMPPAQERGTAMDEDDGEARPYLIAYALGGAVGIAPLLAQGRTEIVVRPLAEVSVRVGDRHGRAIRHFGIDLGRGRPRPLYVHAPGGSFTIPGLLPGLYRLRVDTPEGDAIERFTVPTRGAANPLQVQAKGEVGVLRVYFYSADGDGSLARCEVALSPIPGRRSTPKPIDERGYVEFAGVPAGLTRIDLLPCRVGGRRYPAQSRQLRLRPDRIKIIAFGASRG